MRYIPRAIQPVIRRAARNFPAVVVTGPRRSGKTTLLRRMFPRASYHLLEDPDILARARSDPRGLLEGLQLPAMLDEIQNAPELLSYIRSRIDARPGSRGQWLLTGSQEAQLMQGVTESMAGRAAVLQLLPLSIEETDRVSLLTGGFPEAVGRPSARDLWFSSYLQTYLERDVRSILNVRDLATFRRFLALVASRHGQVLNRTDLAAPLGVSVPTINQWLDVLEITGQIAIVPPFYENLGKRLVKSPKIYVFDSGLACHLLGIRNQSELNRSPFLGVLFEGMVAAEILKHQANHGMRKELYFFRDYQGLEVDFLCRGSDGAYWLIECKTARTLHPAMASPLQTLANAFGKQIPVRCAIVHPRDRADSIRGSLAPGVEAFGLRDFLKALGGASSRRGG